MGHRRKLPTVDLPKCAACIAILFFFSTPWLACSQDEAIPAGTVITKQNWQQYKQFMPPGLQLLFTGKGFWKLPDNARLSVSGIHHYVLPKPYLENTEKYAANIRIVNLPNGGHSIADYVAGIPFPNPQEPLRGWKILVDDWYSYVPYNMCSRGWYFAFVDRLNNFTYDTGVIVYRRLSFISDVGMPINLPDNGGVDYSEYLQLLSPEQARYTTELTLYYADPARQEDAFLFVPALRRSLRISTNARCSPLFGSDYAYDDTRAGNFNGGITRFEASFKGDHKILMFIPDDRDDLTSKLDNYYRPLFFPSPTIGNWEVRDTWLIDIRRLPSERAGYCYSHRLNYVDKELYLGDWVDLYDEVGKLWKSYYTPIARSTLPGFQGPLPVFGGVSTIWDQQSGHLSITIFGNSNDPVKYNGACGNYHGVNFNDVRKYASISALNEVLQ
jgi:hypothetical protein